MWQLRALAVAQADAEAALWKDGSRVRRIARAMCQADGHEPDDVTMGVPNQEPYRGAKGTTAIYAPIRPQWMLYVSEAVTAIELVGKDQNGQLETAEAGH